MHYNAVILAAGEQTRFPGPKPKCLYTVGGETIIERLGRKLGDCPRCVVINDDWPDKYKRQLGSITGCVVEVERGLHIGYSIWAGLKALPASWLGREHDATLIVAADTFIPSYASLLCPTPGQAIFDPWAWVTIYCIHNTRSMTNHLRDKCHDRVAYLGTNCLETIIKRTGYVNVNQPEGLLRARILEEA